MSVRPKIEASWLKVLEPAFNAPSFTLLKEFLVEERLKHTIYPNGDAIFSAYNFTPINDVKVVILGQDPYHNPKQANGFSFSVSQGISLPPSLKNIYKEISDDLGIEVSSSNGDLTAWAEQGVFLLNSILTVRANTPASHQKKGWEAFTDATIKAISEHQTGVVFLLWGKFAQAKKVLIDPTKHIILEAAHPSPFSAHSGFFGCKHFSKTNQILEQQGKTRINWQIV